MTESYRQEELKRAKEEETAARAKYAAAKAKGWNSKTARLAEAVEFWSNKVAFLSSARHPQQETHP